MPPLNIDPFFDGRGSGPARGTPTTAATAYTPDPQRYSPVAALSLMDGRPAAAVIPGGGSGNLRGTVIPRATPGGVPAGVRPSQVADLHVNIDPHIVGQRSTLRLGDVTGQMIEQATNQVRNYTPDPYDIQTTRLRGAAVLHEIAQATHAPGSPVYQPGAYQGNFAVLGQQPQAYFQQSPGPYVAGQPQQMQQVPQMQQYPPQQMQQYPPPQFVQQQAPQPMRIQNPLQAFRQAEQDHMMQRELRAIDLSRPIAPATPVASTPTIRVTFEIDRFGTHAAKYHDVVVAKDETFMVLIYNTEYDGDPYFPPVATGEDIPPMAVNVVGTPDVYLVHTTGIQYDYLKFRHCVLLIERKAPLPDEPGEPQQPPVQPHAPVVSGQLEEGVDT